MNVTMSITIYELMIMIISILGSVFALIQWRQSYKLKRAELIKKAIEETRNDQDLVQVMYSIDYGEEWYGYDFIKDHNKEEKFDRAFALFDYICYMKMIKIFGDDEFSIFEYRIQRMAKNKSFLEYFFNLYHFSEKQKTEFSFYHLLKYMRKNHLIDEDFYDKDSSKYKKYLNF